MSQYNILVVDDDREIVRSLGKLLELEGYRVKKAYNGMEALDILMTEPIHLILLDVMMPKMNGLSALMKIREKNNIPIIMLSAKTEESDKVIGLSMGADDYVTKPYNTAELMARVKSQLRRYFSLGAANGTTQSQDILKIGADVAGDLRSLRQIRHFRDAGFVDLQTIAPQWGIGEKSLRKLSAIVLGRRVSKAQRLSNWEAATLTDKQQLYAATDAWVCTRIYEQLLRTPKKPIRK